MRAVSCDKETFPIGPGEVIPKLVCATFAWLDDQGQLASSLFAHCEEGLHELLKALLEDDETLLVFHNAGYDLRVQARAYPDLIPLIYAKLAKELCTDTGIREKILNNTTTGQMLVRELPDGSKQHIEYTLAALGIRYLGKDRTAEKDDPTSWRLRFGELYGKRSDEYPAEAAAYAQTDALDTLAIYLAQHGTMAEQGPGSMFGAEMKTALDFALKGITARGMATDPVERERLEGWIAGELSESKHTLLVEAGILRPAQPARPVKTSAKKLAPLLNVATADEAKALIDSLDWTPEALEEVRAAGIKTTMPKAASFCESALHGRISALCETLKLPVQRTEPSLTNPEGNVQADEKVIAKLAPHDPVLLEYQHYQGLRQIATKELPAMRAPFVHFNYSAIVSSYRTSSSGNRKGKVALYPATNGQNINPKVRNAYVPRPGHIFLSADYDRLELCTLAQKCIDLFGASLMADKINAGVDLHAYLGAQIALKLDSAFGPACSSFASDPMEVYKAFQVLEILPTAPGAHDAQAIYKKYRKLAKPTGLGFPGGLGPARFVGYAAGKKYGVKVDEETARALREIWHGTYPEMRPYFKWINEQCIDPHNLSAPDEDTGERGPLYCYWSPLGLYCAGVNYTDACNGAGMQTFASDGFGIAVFNVARACQDPTMGSVLYGCHVVAEIHDEIILEIPWESHPGGGPAGPLIDYARACAQELADIMEASMRQIVTDVKITAKPLLMHRWDSDAEPTFDAQGMLIPWTSKPKEIAA